MSHTMSVPERALQLASAGACRTIQDIKRQLSKERYEQVEAHLSGRAIKAQLTAAFRARNAVKPVDEPPA